MTLSLCRVDVKLYLPTDSETVEQYLNFVRTRFLISVLVFVSRDCELGRVSDFRGVDRQSRTGLIFLLMMNAENDRWDNNNGHVSRNIQCQ